MVVHENVVYQFKVVYRSFLSWSLYRGFMF